MAARQDEAGRSFAKLKPQLSALGAQAASLATDRYGKEAVKVLRHLVDDEVSGEEWMRKLLALAIGHWVKPLEKLAQRVSKSATQDLHPSTFITFEIDEASQATDPMPLDVTPEIRQAVMDARVIPGDLVSGTQTIPAANIRFSVFQGMTFISLVGIGELELEPDEFSCPIVVTVLPPPSLSAANPQTLTIGYAHTSVAEGPT